LLRAFSIISFTTLLVAGGVSAASFSKAQRRRRIHLIDA
jgi:hypothetical protein